MQIGVEDPQFQTLLFSVLFLTALLFSLRKQRENHYFSVFVTNELKGIAILAVIFSHIGYFLFQTTQFLFPLSVLGGVGVNLFLFLSGFGLTASSLKKPLSPLNFYKKRLIKLFSPLWLVLALFFAADLFFLGRSFSMNTVIKSFLGWFPSADIYRDLNSPLWYFTPIIFYYLIFPWFFQKKLSFISPILILLLSVFILNIKLPVQELVFNLYKLHILAFPLGMIFALVAGGAGGRFLQGLLSFLNGELFKEGRRSIFFRFTLILLLSAVFIYTSFNSGVGEDKVKEQTISLVTTFSLVFIFLLKDIKFKFLNIFGEYSYLIYLIHWPLMYRYDLLYKNLPPSIATVAYLLLFIILGILLQKSVDWILKKFAFSFS